ncbi:MAG: hypothetical protein ACI9R8_001046 [Candidatus Paceibacteria bacterium]|jgi:hypothetical protein
MTFGIVITYCLGIACIVFPKHAIKVIQAISDFLLEQAKKKVNGPVPKEDTIIGPKFSIVIGVAIRVITAFAQAIKH